jgi:hypothetical protein
MARRYPLLKLSRRVTCDVPNKVILYYDSKIIHSSLGCLVTSLAGRSGYRPEIFTVSEWRGMRMQSAKILIMWHWKDLLSGWMTDYKPITSSTSDYIQIHREMLKLFQFSRYDHHSTGMIASNPGAWTMTSLAGAIYIAYKKVEYLRQNWSKLHPNVLSQ